MSTKNQSQHAKLNFSDCMGMAIGQIIGSGVMVLTGIVIGLTGHGTPLAYILGALLAITTCIPFIILTSTIPASGAGYTYVKRLLGDKASFMYIGMFVLSQVLIATFAKGFASYFCSIFQGFNEAAVAMAALILCTLVNMVGLKSTARVQKLMVGCLLLSLLLFIVFGLPKVDWSTLKMSTANIMPNGPKSFLTGVALLSFACGGAKFIAENGDDIENPASTIPKAIFASTSLVAVFYAFIGIVASGVLPIETVAYENLTQVAQEIFPTWLYIFFVFGGAMFALLTTLNGTLSWVTRGLEAAAREGWLPESWAKENKNGVPVIILGVFFVMGALPIVTGMDLTLISNMGVGTDMLTEFMVLLACWKLPDVLPEEYKKSAFYMKKGTLHALLIVIGILMIGTSYVNLSDLTVPAAIACGIYVLALFIYTQLRYKHVLADRSGAK
ncbi:APC family permease [Galactobacillus timonensis]|uniref:APC family permease n=1 Tax=Galactobacillus timonensis TaxID=2041840 RepID=UPI000C864B65|nr:APC family permease [Galactobacillus timonensis]